MERVGTTETLPAKKVVREKGSYHPDVLAIIEVLNKSEVSATPRSGSDPKSNLWEGTFETFAFEDDKEASARAASLRKAGFVAVVRGNELYASNKDGDTEDDEAEEE